MTRLSTAARSDPSAQAERKRRQLLEETDRMLDHVELVHLEEARTIPPLLLLRMRRLLGELGRREPSGLERVDRFHDLLFAVQQRLMAGNPRRVATRVHAGRAAGAPIVIPIGTRERWKQLVLPPAVAVEGADGFESWLGLVDATVERALDRWNYAMTHLLRCARDSTRRHRAAAALAIAIVAWDNYWELAEEAGHLHARTPEPLQDAA